jgi:hypothetical protein
MCCLAQQQVVSRTVEAKCSAIKLVVADLDTVVTLGVVKSLRAMLRDSKGSSAAGAPAAATIDVETVQERLLREAQHARQARIEALKAAFQVG